MRENKGEGQKDKKETDLGRERVMRQIKEGRREGRRGRQKQIDTEAEGESARERREKPATISRTHGEQ